METRRRRDSESGSKVSDILKKLATTSKKLISSVAIGPDGHPCYTIFEIRKSIMSLFSGKTVFSARIIK